MLKRKLEELIAIYSLEDELEDVYVEGPTDRFILENYFEHKKPIMLFYEIDDIEIYEHQEQFPDLDLRSHKDKLIALSRILSKINIESRVACIVDRDFDDILQPLESNAHLYYTDYSCMEAYFFCKSYILKFTKIGIRNFPHSPEVIISEVGKVLRSLFIMRMVNKHFSYSFSFPKIENHMPVVRATGVCGFNFENYLETYINLNRLKADKESIFKFIDEISGKLSEDPRFNMNGHDFVEVLYSYINKIKNTPNFKQDNFEKALFLSIQPNYFDDYHLFMSLAG